MEKTIRADKELIAYCGLYCGACPRFIKGKCAGCRESEKLSWCKIRDCNRDHGYHDCSDCTQMDFSDCKLNHNLMASFFGLIFNSDRDACVAKIREVGKEGYAGYMAENGKMSFKRRN